MKRVFSIVLVIALALCVFAGCSSDDKADVKLSDVLDQINEKYPDSVKGLTKITDVEDLSLYYDIEPDLVEDFAAEHIEDNSQAALEIVIIKTNNVDEVEQKLDVCYKGVLSQYASYSAEQLKMAKDGGVDKTGSYVYFVVSENSKDIMKYIKDTLG